MRNPFKTFLKIRKSYGLRAGVIYILNRLGGLFCNLRVEHFVTLPIDQITESGPLPDGFEGRWLTPDEVLTYSQDESNDLPAEFADRARQNNRCFGILTEGRLASYSWYALQNIEPEHFFGTGMQLPASLVYMYKGFTHPDFRGQRLHAKGMQLALQSLSEVGVQALVSTVDWTNNPSLKSCDRLGYQRLGRLVKCVLLGRTFNRFPAAALQFGITQGYSLPGIVPAQS